VSERYLFRRPSGRPQDRGASPPRYRREAGPGGIPETYFWPYIGERWGYGTGRIEDLAGETAAHPLFDDFWAGSTTRTCSCR
jgi:hypothetical protein